MLHKLFRFIHARRHNHRRQDPPSAAEQHPPIEIVVNYLTQILDEYSRQLNETDAERSTAPPDSTGNDDT